jgi:uncharacterized membrane protein (Fun14 family)
VTRIRHRLSTLVGRPSVGHDSGTPPADPTRRVRAQVAVPMDEAPTIEPTGLRTDLARLARWKKALLAFAGMLVVVGAAWMPFEQGDRSDLSRIEGAATASGEAAEATEDPDGDPIARLHGVGSSLLPGGPTLPLPGAGEQEAGDQDSGPLRSDGPASSTDETLSPALLQMGFSFFAAFAVGLAFRSFLKIAMVFVGMQLLALFGLSYVEWITVHWQTMSDAFDRFVANAQGEFASFQSFVTGSLPQVGLASLGLVAGFKK